MTRTSPTQQSRGGGRWVSTGLLCAMVIFLAGPRASATPGVITQKPFELGCIVYAPAPSDRGCAESHRLGAQDLAISGDGKNVYSAGYGSGDSLAAGFVTVFDRDGHSGELTQKEGPAGCIAREPTAGCETYPNMGAGEAIEVSPDGRHLYVLSRNNNGVRFAGGIQTFSRDRDSGALTPVPGVAGCFGTSAEGACAVGRAMTGAHDFVISPNGRNIYVISDWRGDYPNGTGAMVVLNRDPKTGRLTQPEGAAGCISFVAAAGCLDGFPYDAPASVGISPDGRHVYVTAVHDGARAEPNSDTVAIFSRDTDSGALTQLAGANACVSDVDASDPECDGQAAVEWAYSLTISPDGANAYIASYDKDGQPGQDAVVVMDRDTQTGALTQKAGSAGCIADDPYDSTVCADGKLLSSPFDVVVSPDGTNVYTATNGHGAPEPISGIAVLDRDPDTGELKQKPRRVEGCVWDLPRDGFCSAGRELDYPRGLAVSPDGSNLYAAGFRTVSTFDREHLTYIETASESPRTNGSLRFTFGSTQRPATFECRIDWDPFAPCPVGNEYEADVGDGVHTFAVRAIVGETPDATPAVRHVVVDTTPPNTYITSGAQSDWYGYRVDVESSELDSTFECQVDQEPVQRTSDPYCRFLSPAEGDHTLRVTAIDNVGLSDPTPATLEFEVDNAAPSLSIMEQPLGTIKTDRWRAPFTISWETDASDVVCEIDQKPASPCTSPLTGSVRARRSKTIHRVTVTASDGGGTASAVVDFSVRRIRRTESQP